MRIKSAYEAGNYKSLAADADTLFTKYPDTIFRAELLLYQMRGYHQTGENEALLEVSKEFLREYSDDENMGEVLAYTANAYSAVGLQKDGEYFYERLFTEFGDSKYAALGMVFLGDRFMQSGKYKEANKYFEQALYKTSDVEVASMAAIRLANMSLTQGELESASALYEKIIEGNEKYLLHDISQNYDNARAFSNRKHQKTAANILIAITHNLEAGDDRYEAMMKDIGLWLSETSDTAMAYNALKNYQTKYGTNGDYAQEVEEALDSLFYTPQDANTTALLAKYELLEEKYKNEEIGNKAALQKARLLYSIKQYQAVLDMQNSGAVNEPGYFEIQQKAALALVLIELESKRCANAISLSQEHNISVDAKYDEGLYQCAYETGNYALAKETSLRHIKDKEKRLLWLYNYAKTLNKVGQYEELVKVADDVISLSALDIQTAMMIFYKTHLKLMND